MNTIADAVAGRGTEGEKDTAAPVAKKSKPKKTTGKASQKGRGKPGGSAGGGGDGSGDESSDGSVEDGTDEDDDEEEEEEEEAGRKNPKGKKKKKRTLELKPQATAPKGWTTEVLNVFIAAVRDFVEWLVNRPDQAAAMDETDLETAQG